MTIRGEAFLLEVAVDEATQDRGLGGRTVGARGGMLFVFPVADEKLFVMRNCAETLDLLYLDSDRRVMRVHSMPPEAPRGKGEQQNDMDGDTVYAARLKGYASGGPAKYAVEVRGGTAARLGVALGDEVVFVVDGIGGAGGAGGAEKAGE